MNQDKVTTKYGRILIRELAHSEPVLLSSDPKKVSEETRAEFEARVLASEISDAFIFDARAETVLRKHGLHITGKFPGYQEVVDEYGNHFCEVDEPARVFAERGTPGLITFISALMRRWSEEE